MTMLENNDFQITIASLPDREHLVAEVLYKGVQWAEISQETEEIVVQLYPHPRQHYWEFPYDDAVAALQQAKQKLVNI